MQQSVVENFCDWVRLIQSDTLKCRGCICPSGRRSACGISTRQAWILIFGALEAANFLKRMPNDVYIRADVGC